MDVVIVGGKLVGDPTRAVRRIVVGNEDVRLGYGLARRSA
jgi:hypothetical protein